MSTPTTSNVRVLNGRYALKPSPTSGGMSAVFAATDMEEGQTKVAVKMVETADDALSSKVWDREYRALLRLVHPNVVRLLGADRDNETNKRFLVFEWIDGDLEKRQLEGATPEGWDDFVRDLGLPLFEALSAAHQAGVAHRDIKPANILIDNEGVPKLADFGIAKIISDAAPGRTVGDFRSEPFAAPLEEGVDRHTSGDVYSLGVTALAVLSGLPPFENRFKDEPRRFVEEALDAIDAPTEAMEFLRRCTAAKIAERYRTGGVAMADLQTLTLRREEAAKKLGFRSVPVCYLSLSGKAKENLVADLNLESVDEAEAYFLADLAEQASFLPIPPNAAGGSANEGQFFLLGSELRSRVEPISGSPRLRVHSARHESGSFLDRDRARAWTGIVDFSLGQPPDPSAAEQDLSEIVNSILDVSAERRRAGRRPKEHKVLATWRRSLQALAEIERGREKPITYSNVIVGGNTVTFTIDGGLGQELLSQMRIAELIDGSLLAGQVAGVAGDKLRLRVEQGDVQQLPRKGNLKVDQRLGRVALRRQESTLDAVQRGAISRPQLEQILVDPASTRPPLPVTDPQWCQEHLDAPKKAAVKAALGSNDLLLVEGPPGTGKTTLIVELIAQELKRNPDVRILLSSQTHSALDNVLERLSAVNLGKPPRLLRIARAKDERIAEDVENLLIGPQLGEWRSEVIKGGRDFLRDWARKNEISVQGVEVAMRLDELASVVEALESTEGDVSSSERHLEVLRDTRRAGGETSNETISNVQDRIATLRREKANSERLRADLVERLRELNAAPPGEEQTLDVESLRAAAADAVDRNHPSYQRCTEFVRLLGDWHARFGRGPEFETAALIRAQVVAGTCVGLAAVPGWEEIEFDLCIVDEASKANATELLIPMSRADRWVVVGDHRQLPPHLDEALLDREL